MQCPQCNHEIAGDATFCPYCGERLGENRPAPQSTPQSRSPELPQATNPAERLLSGAQRDVRKQPPEKDLWSGSYSPKALFGPFLAIDVLACVAIIGVVLLWNTGAGWLALVAGIVVLYGGLGLKLLYQRLSLHYRLTTYRFFHERGLLSRLTDRIEVIDIDDVTVHQGLIERMLGVGTILIASSDRTHPQLRLPGIDDVRHVANLIDNTRRAERQRRGIHIESI